MKHGEILYLHLTNILSGYYAVEFTQNLECCSCQETAPAAILGLNNKFLYKDFTKLAGLGANVVSSYLLKSESPLPLPPPLLRCPHLLVEITKVDTTLDKVPKAWI